MLEKARVLLSDSALKPKGVALHAAASCGRLPPSEVHLEFISPAFATVLLPRPLSVAAAQRNEAVVVCPILCSTPPPCNEAATVTPLLLLTWIPLVDAGSDGLKSGRNGSEGRVMKYETGTL